MSLKKIPLLEKTSKIIEEKIKSNLFKDFDIKKKEDDIAELKKEIVELKEVVNQKNSLIDRINKRLASHETELTVVSNDLVSTLTLLNEIHDFIEVVAKKKKTQSH